MADYVNKYKVQAQVEGANGALFLHETLDTETFTALSRVERTYNSAVPLEAVPIAAGDILIVLADSDVVIRLDGDNTKVFSVSGLFVVDTVFSSLSIAVPSGPSVKVVFISITKE